MSADEDHIKSEMRPYALEIVVANLLATSCFAAAPGDPLAVCERIRKQLVKSARNRTFRDVDPALSDLSAELETAVCLLAERAHAQISEALKMLAQGRPGKTPSSP